MAMVASWSWRWLVTCIYNLSDPKQIFTITVGTFTDEAQLPDAYYFLSFSGFETRSPTGNVKEEAPSSYHPYFYIILMSHLIRLHLNN